MSEEVEFEVKLSSEWHNDPLKFELLLDDKLIDSGELIEKKANKEARTLTFKESLDEGEHTIKIRMLGKTGKHTIVDNDNNILADMLLNVDSISIDQIDLGHLVHKLSVFYPNETFAKMSGIPTEIPNLTCIGYNGEFRLKFQVPTYLWLLENF